MTISRFPMSPDPLVDANILRGQVGALTRELEMTRRALGEYRAEAQRLDGILHHVGQISRPVLIRAIAASLPKRPPAHRQVSPQL